MNFHGEAHRMKDSKAIIDMCAKACVNISWTKLGSTLSIDGPIREVTNNLLSFTLFSVIFLHT